MEEVKLPNGTEYTIIVPLDKDANKRATFHLKGMQEDVYMAAKSMIDRGKDFDAIRLIVKQLWLGGDSPELLNNNFVAVQSATKLVLQILEPIDGELKKN